MKGYRVVDRGPAWHDRYAAYLADPEAAFARDDTWILKERAGGRTIGLVACGADAVVVKIYEEVAWIDALERLVLGSRARRAAGGIRRMRAAGLPAPELIAVLETPLSIGGARSCLVTGLAHGGRADLVWERMGRAERCELLCALAKLLRRVHGCGLYPQDVWITNFVAEKEEGAWRVQLVDLDRVRRYRRLSWRRRCKNLVQLERSLGRSARATERLRFLRIYLGDADRGTLRRAAAEVIATSARRDVEKGVAPL